MNTNVLILLALLSEASTPPEPWSLSNIKTNRPLALELGEAWCSCSYGGFVEADLPAGYRPMLKGELVLGGDEVKLTTSGWVKSNNHNANNGEQTSEYLYRTTRPLPAIAEPDPYQELRDAEAAGKVI